MASAANIIPQRLPLEILPRNFIKQNRVLGRVGSQAVFSSIVLRLSGVSDARSAPGGAVETQLFLFEVASQRLGFLLIPVARLAHLAAKSHTTRVRTRPWKH